MQTKLSMFKNLSLKHRMIFLIGGFSLATILLTTTGIILRVRSNTLEEAVARATDIANTHSQEVAVVFEKGYNYARSMRNLLEGTIGEGIEIERSTVRAIFRDVLEENEDFYGVWNAWESNEFDGRDAEFADKPFYDSSGRMIAYVRRDDNGSIIDDHCTGMDTGSWYNVPLRSGEDYLDGPVYYDVLGLLASFTSPIKINGKVVGVAGLDYELTTFSKRMAEIRPWGTGSLEIVNDKGVYIAHPDPSLAGKNMFEHDSSLDHLRSQIEGNQIYSEAGYSNDLNTKVYRIVVPLTCEGTNQTIATIVSVPIDTIMASVNTIVKISVVIGSLAAALLFGVIFYVGQQISKPITQIADVLATSSKEVTSASGQVSTSSISLAQNSSEQASRLEETSASTEEITSMVKQNASDAVYAKERMQNAGNAIGEANDHIAALNQSMTEISTSSEETKKIIKTIDEIAFQTNILALNAAVEAARAGEAGAGFAVVADEVRSLAGRAAEAAQDSTSLIEESVTKIGQGNQLVERVSSSMSNVTEVANDVGQLIDKISEATNQQTQGLEQINRAMGDIDHSIQENAASSEESAAAAEQLNAQSYTLTSMVNNLEHLILGGAADTRNKQKVETPLGVSPVSSRSGELSGFSRDSSDHLFQSN